MDLARTGRPKLENPKKNRVTVRFDDEEFQRLEKCARKMNLTITETVRKGVEEMLDSKP